MSHKIFHEKIKVSHEIFHDNNNTYERKITDTDLVGYSKLLHTQHSIGQNPRILT